MIISRSVRVLIEMRYTGIMTLTRFGFNIPSFTYADIDDADMFDTVCAAATTAERSGW